MKTILTELSSCLNDAKNGMDNSIPSVDLPQSQIDSWTALINSDNSSVVSNLSSLNSEGSTLRATATDIQNQKNTVSNNESQLKMYQDLYNTMMNGPSSQDRQLQMNNIKQSQISLSQLGQQTKNYEIRAPFDGNIDIINIKVGDNITTNTIQSESITVSNPNVYEVDMLIDQVDIVKINKGQPVEISFDAYPGYVVTGSISEINPTPVTNA
jgi:multidrug resistance efflux pump